VRELAAVVEGILNAAMVVQRQLPNCMMQQFCDRRVSNWEKQRPAKKHDIPAD
jgi:hypothetical protein